MTVRILQGDCRKVLPTLPDASVDSIVTDPPYGLGFMGKDWDHAVPGVEFWREMLRVAKPGAHLLAFGGTRTFHRIVCAIEDAGWEIRDQIMWLYGSGFPKSLDVSKAIDRAVGAERTERVLRDRYHDGRLRQEQESGSSNISFGCAANGSYATLPASAAARQWQGWGTALKPAHEPIIVARKPLVGTVAANVQAHGTGALNIDGCRVNGDKGAPASLSNAGVHGWRTGGDMDRKSEQNGRWPANVCHDGSEEVIGQFPIEACAAAPVHRRNADKFRGTYGAFAGNTDEGGSTFHGDIGSAARFFYCAKASREDRNVGCEDLDTRPLNWSSGEQSPGTFQSANTDRTARNHHPTVKPTDLMRWLVRLVTPPGGTVLDPFAGSGSTGRAADVEGFDAILIELNPEYVAIARRRIAGDAPLFAQGAAA